MVNSDQGWLLFISLSYVFKFFSICNYVTNVKPRFIIIIIIVIIIIIILLYYTSGFFVYNSNNLEVIVAAFSLFKCLQRITCSKHRENRTFQQMFSQIKAYIRRLGFTGQNVLFFIIYMFLVFCLSIVRKRQIILPAS